MGSTETLRGVGVRERPPQSLLTMHETPGRRGLLCSPMAKVERGESVRKFLSTR